jgi:hypothetical protein
VHARCARRQARTLFAVAAVQDKQAAGRGALADLLERILARWPRGGSPADDNGGAAGSGLLVMYTAATVWPCLLALPADKDADALVPTALRVVANALHTRIAPGPLPGLGLQRDAVCVRRAVCA